MIISIHSINENGKANCGGLISSISDIFTSIDGYHIYLYKEYEFEGVSHDLSISFDEYAQRIGDNAAIFKSIDYESYEKSLKKLFDSDPWFSMTIGDVNKLAAGVFITRPSLQRFCAAKGQAFIYVSQGVINDAYKNNICLSMDIVDLCRYDADRFISRILKYSRGAIINNDSKNEVILNTILDSVKIEPNINGLGVDLKPILKNVYGLLNKDNKKTPVYDCVVYRY